MPNQISIEGSGPRASSWLEAIIFIMLCDIYPNAAADHPQHSIPEDLYKPYTLVVDVTLRQEDGRLPDTFFHKSDVHEGRLYQVNNLIPVACIRVPFPYFCI